MQFPYPSPDPAHITVFTKSNCSFCEKIKALLEFQDRVTIYIPCDSYLTDQCKPFFLQHIATITGTQWKTFPMVFMDGQFIGGYNDTIAYLH